MSKNINSDENNEYMSKRSSRFKGNIKNENIKNENIKNENIKNEYIKNITEIKNIKDLINLGKLYSSNIKDFNGINLRVLHNLIVPLSELDLMIGIENVKNKIIDNCLYIARGYNSVKCNSCIDCNSKIACVANSKEMLHTVITGPPGVGKTQLARILTQIYSKIGVIKKNKIIEVSRKDLISGYLGKTSKKTQKIFNKAKNGVLFIDEAYSLGNIKDDDIYSKECIDIINKNLSENRDTIVIIAGYEKEINECFFRVNPGLERRFPFRYNIDGYTGEELFEILYNKIISTNWKINENEKINLKKYIILNKNKYKNFAGDMESLLMKAKIKNSRNIFSQNYIFVLNDFIE
jgi:hypothetical protein